MPKSKNQLTLAKSEFKRYLRQSVDVARTLRDELKVQAHLGTTEAKAHWAEIERRLGHVDTLAHELNHVAGQLIDRLVDGAVRKTAVARSRKRKAKARR